ncbi:MAG: adenylosuccinate lyase [Anaerolineales bacterium]|nr:adenylosuccinate lyase [Anaerolineales bacterium]
MTDFEIYRSPYSWRYASSEMRKIWSEAHKRRLWRNIWVTLAEVQSEFGLAQPDQAADLRAHMDDIDVRRSLEIEAQIHHDLMAEVKTFAEQCPRGGGIIHLGATSVDVKDNATALQLREALDLILGECRHLLGILSPMMRDLAEIPVMAYTHLQPAEPTTLGYRLAQYAQDLLADWENLRRVRRELRGKGFKGAVGTSASYGELLGLENLTKFEALLSEKLDLLFYPVTTQTYPRKQEYEILSVLAGLGASLYKFAFDLRILQSPPIGELAEPFSRVQVGSSAMPFKRNPIRSEKIDSLARMLAQFPRLAWDNAAHSLLERTLDDSANRRTMLPEAFLIADELLRVATATLKGLQMNEKAMAHNMSVYGPFAATERLLNALGKAGADRQQMHERLREHTLQAWEATRAEQPNPLAELIAADPKFLEYLTVDELDSLMDASAYVGDAPRRAQDFAQVILDKIGDGALVP